jgi:hypothetical protein
MELLPLPDSVVWGSLGAAIAVACSAAYRAREIPLTARMGSPRWDFSQSWASTFTGAAGILGGALSAQLIPGDGFLLPQRSYVSLAVFFSALALLAPLAYASARQPVRVAADSAKSGRFEYHYQGRVIAFFIAGAITLWAFFGQAALVGMLFAEIRAAGHLSSAAVAAVQAVLSAVGVLMAVHASSSLTTTVRQQRTSSESGRGRLLETGPAVEPALPPWPLL